MIERDIAPLLLLFAQSFRAVLVVGPRQSGKTTLVKQTFPHKPYVSLENPDERLLASQDPRAFLNRFPEGAILDEIQQVPLLLSYLQEILDLTESDGLFILTGSNNILLQEYTSQTLAGRIGVLDLLPLSCHEVFRFQPNQNLSDLMLNGFYPEVLAKKRNSKLWFSSYIRTYLERDVRQVKQIENSLLFQKFIRLCAGRVGQQVNIVSLSTDCGINVRTAQAWLSVLESTYVVHLLQPFYENYNKRLIKSPKLYFYDVGLACSLLNIKTKDELAHSHFSGALFENFIIADFIKQSFNFQTGEQYFYWRDNNGVEIDLIRINGEAILPIEIKSGETYSPDFIRNLKKFMNYSGIGKGLLLYNGSASIQGSDGIEISHWRNYLLKNGE